MDGEEKRIKEMQDMYKERIEVYEQSKQNISKELEGKKGRDKEYVENRIASCDRLIDQYQEKLNPTKKKEMYK